MSIKELNSFNNSKVASHKVITDSQNSGLGLGTFGNNTHKRNVSFKSNSKAAKNPTTL